MAKKVSPRKSASGKRSKAAKPTAKSAPRKAAKKVAKRAKSAPKKVANRTKSAPKKTAKKLAGKAVAKSPRSAKPARPARKSTAKAAAKLDKRRPKSKKGRKATGKASVPLTRSELKEFRKLLLAKRRELVGDMTGIEAEALGADRQESKGDISDHPADAGTDNFEQEFSLGLLESEQHMLAEIDQALSQIEQGTYGVCRGTGKQISKARLAARPWAPYSIEYARMVEKGLVRAGERIDSDDEDDD